MGVVAAASRRQPTALLHGSTTVPLPRPVTGLKGQVYRRQPSFCRLLSWGLFSVQFAGLLLLERLRRLYGRGRWRRLLLVSNPPFVPLLGPLSPCPYVLVLYDLYPEVLAQLCPPGARSTLRSVMASRLLTVVQAFWARANRFAFARAEAVITLSPGMADALRPYFRDARQWQERVHVVPPWADTAWIRPIPADRNPFRGAQGLDDRFIAIYSGNLGLTHPLELLLDAAHLLPEVAPGRQPIELVIIGDGPKRSALERLANTLALRHLRLLDPLPIEQVSHSYSAADLAVVCLDGPAAQASLPSKTFTALATGTPILALAPIGSELAALVQRHHCGVVVPPGPGAATAIAAHLLELASDPGRCAAMAAAALEASKAYGEANADRLVDIWLGQATPPGPEHAPKAV